MSAIRARETKDSLYGHINYEDTSNDEIKFSLPRPSESFEFLARENNPENDTRYRIVVRKDGFKVEREDDFF